MRIERGPLKGLGLTERAVMFFMTVEGMLLSPDQTGLLNNRLEEISIFVVVLDVKSCRRQVLARYAALGICRYA